MCLSLHTVSLVEGGFPLPLVSLFHSSYALGEELGDTLGVLDTDTLGEALGVLETDTDGVLEGEFEGETDGVELGEVLGVLEGDADTDTLGDESTVNEQEVVLPLF